MFYFNFCDQDISNGKYIQLVNEARAVEAKQKSADMPEEGGKGGKVSFFSTSNRLAHAY